MQLRKELRMSENVILDGQTTQGCEVASCAERPRIQKANLSLRHMHVSFQA